ncbi:MAG: ketoacyl-ACP synthase III [Bdellovibrionales bacterium]|nr:ketoacyl-ACP synthase III [Bdellovibrionales bacterium]
MLRTKIASTGMYVPSRIVTNEELEPIMDTSDEWIQQRSGISERRWVTDSDTTCSMAVAASKDALNKANLTADDIDAIIFGALVTDYIFPGTGVLLQKELGCSKPIPALDIRNQCSGFLYGMQVADAWIRSGMYKRVLLIGSEIHSTSLDKSPRGRDVSVLFGDGAGAVILEATTNDTSLIMDTAIYSEGAYAEKLYIGKPSTNDRDRLSAFMTGEELPREAYPIMDGKFVFKHAVTRMAEAFTEVCKRNNVDFSEVSMVIPHQANIRINHMILESLGIPKEKSHHTIQKYGNTTMASIPITLDEAVTTNKIKRGDLIAFVGFGAGFTWGAGLARY